MRNPFKKATGSMVLAAALGGLHSLVENLEKGLKLIETEIEANHAAVRESLEKHNAVVVQKDAELTEILATQESAKTALDNTKKLLGIS